MRHVSWWSVLVALMMASEGKAQVIDPAAAVARIEAERQARLEQNRVDMLRAQVLGQLPRAQYGGDNHYITLETEPAPPAIAAEEEDAAEDPPFPVAVRPRLNLQTARLASENFDRWVFGDGVTEADVKMRLQKRLAEAVHDAGGRRPLDERDRAKLWLAGRGDIKRLLDRVAVERRAFEEARKSVTEGRKVLLGLGQMEFDLRVGPFGDTSLFAKTRRRIEIRSTTSQ